ncbi:MAG: ABC transporter ATP-binding protein [Chloroflexi bacterium]|nr:ABC transporter ATP-binding protein [Chloroflexota bacterium]
MMKKEFMKTITPPAYVTQSEEQYDKAFDPRIARRLVDFIRPYNWRVIIALIFMGGASAASVAGPYFVKVALDDGLAVKNLAVLNQTVLAFVVVSMIQWVCTYFRVKHMAIVGQSVIYDLRKALFAHLQQLSLNFYSHYSVGRVITRVINDVEILRDFLTWGMLAIVRDVFVLIGIIIAMLSMNLRLSLITFTVLPFMALATYIFRREARRSYRKVRAAISWVNSVLAENINGVRVVQAFSRQQTNYEHFSDTTNRYHLQMSLSAAKVSSLYYPVVDVLGAIATALVVWLGGTAVLGEQITAGVLVAFVLYIDRFFEPIRDLFRRIDALQTTMAGGERILGLLDTPIEVQDTPDAVILPPIKGNVSFDGVSFHYSDDQSDPEEATPVLSQINLSIPEGITVALVGETGAGKTTLVKLLSRFHDPTEGAVRVDGFNLRDVTQTSLRSQMGIVLQDPFLFNGTVNENIKFGRLDASDDQIISAAQAVGAHDFIINLKNGYDTTVEEGGVLLSVGQRQLISFARALLADPRILILDEATSSVDTQTEQVIQKALARLLKGRTSFVIAHRLSTIVNADLIVVVHGGMIIEQGTHAELLDKKGYYFELYRTGFRD